MNSKLLGARIREARERRGLSQEQFAALVSRDQRTVSEWENGKRKLAAIDLPVFAAILQVPVLYFFEGDSEDDYYDHAVLAELHQLPNVEAKEAVVEIVRILSNTIRSQSNQ